MCRFLSTFRKFYFWGVHAATGPSKSTLKRTSIVFLPFPPVETIIFVIFGSDSDAKITFHNVDYFLGVHAATAIPRNKPECDCRLHPLCSSLFSRLFTRSPDQSIDNFLLFFFLSYLRGEGVAMLLSHK